MLNDISFFLGLGVVGLTNLSILCLIALYRTYIYLDTQRRLKALDEFTTQKKVVLHALLVLAVAVDLPMYVSFIVIEDYNYITYSFHKFQPMFLLAAYSIIINDWSSVLYSIQEIRRLPLVFRTGFLVFVNAVFSLFCAFNFVLIIAVRDVDKYAGTVTYRISIMLQISITLALTLFMLHAGLGLSRRLQGVSGMLGEARPRADTRGGQQLASSPSTPGLGFGFKTALNRLIVVMTTCSICIFIQLTLMIINYTAGYANQNRSPGPHLFYWTFYAWLPLWGPILSMLHLSRSRLHKADDYDTASHRSGLGGGSAGKKSRLRGGKDEYSARDGSARLLDDVERGSGSSEEDGEQQSPASSSRVSSLSQQGRLLGQLSQHSHQSSKSAASGSTTASGRPQSSVYRPPDYPSSLFRRAGDEEFEASSCESDSVYLDERLTSRTTNSLLSTEYVEGSNHSSRALGAHGGRELTYDHDDEGEVEECGSSEDDHHAYRYDSCFSGDQGVSPRTEATSLRLTGDDFASLLHPDHTQ